MKHHTFIFTFIFTCILFLLVRAISAQVPSPAGGGWYSFEGNEGSFLQAPDSDFLDTKLQDEFTIELWIYPKSLPKVGEIWFLLQKLGSYDMYLTRITTNRGSFYRITFFGVGDLSVGGDIPDLAINQWTHIALRFRKAEPPSFNWLFVNGELKTGPNQPTGWRPLSNFPLLIGRSFDGTIDEIRISNIVRYQSNFAPPNRRFEPDEHTMALWHFDGTGDTVFEDSSGNGNRLSVGVMEKLAWQNRTPMPTRRTETSAIALGKKIYVFGGFDFIGNSFNTTEIYDSETDSWSLGAPMPEHVNHAGIGVVNGKIYIIGGGRSGSKNCWEYDPSRNMWSRKADMKHQRSALWVAELNGKLYTIGGFSVDIGADVVPIEVYDPVTNTWQEKASLPTPRNHLVVATVNGKIYAIGGRGGGVRDNNLVHEYDPKLDSWGQKTSMPTPRSGMMVAVVNNKIHVIGGESIFTAAHEIYDPITDRWEIAPPLLTARSGLAGGVIDNQIYAIGGHGFGGASNVNEMFSLSTNGVAVEPRQKFLTTFGSVKQSFLGQNFPNPFNAETWIPFYLAQDAKVTIQIYNLHGQVVRTLKLGNLEAGYYDNRRQAAYWDGRNNRGELVSSGIYFYNLLAGNLSNLHAMKKMLIHK